MKVIYNPVNGADVRDIWQMAVYQQKKNTILPYEDDSLASYLLGKFGFLQEVEIKNIPTIKKQIEKDSKKTQEEIQEMSVVGLSEEDKKIIEELGGAAVPVAKLRMSAKNRPTSPEQAEGIPNSGKDGDNVEWYGPGLEDDVVSDSMMTLRRPGSTPGVFGAN